VSLAIGHRQRRRFAASRGDVHRGGTGVPWSSIARHPRSSQTTSDRLEGLDPELLADRLRRELAELACRPGVGQIRLDGEEVAEADCLPRRAHKGTGLHREAVGGGDLRPSQITERACDQVERREFCRTCRDRGWPCAMNLWTAAWAARNDSSITTTACSRGDSPVMRGIPPRSPARPASRPA